MPARGAGMVFWPIVQYADEYAQTQFAYYSVKNYPLWCLSHVMYKLLYPSIRVRTVPPVSVRVRVRVRVSVGFMV